MNYNTNLNILSWNVRGLNERNKRLAVRQSILLERPDIITFQETKMQSIDVAQFREMCGRRLDQYVTVPAQGTRGGILIAWRQSMYTLISKEEKQFTLTTTLQNTNDASKIMFTAVYGPTQQNQRQEFYNELKQIKPSGNTPWAVGGDFNVTASPEDRNFPTNSWRATLSFATLISELGLLNLNLIGRHYTWSNDRHAPHLARLDRFLISADWNARYPNSAQRAAPNSSSDHCPLLLSAKTGFQKTNFFRFENLWLRFPALDLVVAEAWGSAPTANTPQQLHNKFTVLQRCIKK